MDPKTRQKALDKSEIPGSPRGIGANITILDARGKPIDLSQFGSLDSRRARPSGGSATSIWGGQIAHLEPNAEVEGDKWYGSPSKPGIVQKMMRDPHVRKSFTAVKGNLLAGLWDFEPVSDEALAIETGKFCSWALFQRLDWGQILSHQLRFFRDGFSLLEYTDDVVPCPVSRFPLHPGKGKAVAYTGFHHRPAWSITDWYQQPEVTSRLSAVKQWLMGSEYEQAGQVTIPATRLVRLTQDQEGADFTGFSQLRSAYGPWNAKVMLTVVEMIFHERTGAPPPTMSLPENVTDNEVDEAEAMCSALVSHERGYLVLPDGYKFAWSQADGGPAAMLSAAIERCNRDIAHNVGINFTLLGAGTQAGSRALAETQQSQFQVDMEVFANLVLRCWNMGSDGWSPIRRLVRVNYGTDVAELYTPQLVVRNLPSRDWYNTLSVLHNLVTAGVVIPDAPLELWARRGMYAPKPDIATSRSLAGNQGAVT